VASCSYFFSHDIMNLLYKGAHLEESAAVFRILMCCFIPISSTYIFGTLLTANGNLKQLNIMATFGIAINIILNLILIPQMTAKGAAISSISTQAFTALAQVFMAQQAFNFRKNYKLLLTIALFIGSVILVNIVAAGLDMYWVYKFAISASACFAIAFIFRLISVRNIYRIVKYED